MICICQVQSDSSSLQTNHQDLRSPGLLLEFRYRGRLFLNIHRPIEPITVEPFSLQRCLDQVHKTRELREHDGPEARVLVS